MIINKISKLQLELQELDQKFNENFDILNALDNYSKSNVEDKHCLNQILTKEEAQIERLKLINENFNINLKRMALKIQIIKIQTEDAMKNYTSLNKYTDLADKSFIDQWIIDYLKKDNSEMIEILRKLKK